MAEIKKDVVAKQQEGTIANENVVDETVNVSKFKTVKQVCGELLANGAKRVAAIRVRSSKVTINDTHTMVSLSLEKAVEGYVSNPETGIFSKGETTTIFASSYSIGSILKENDETAWAANQLIQSPKGLEVILAGARIDIIQEEVTEDVAYKNPFSNSDKEGVSLGHDTIINHVVKIELCPNAKRMLNIMAMNMMGLNM